MLLGIKEMHRRSRNSPRSKSGERRVGTKRMVVPWQGLQRAVFCLEGPCATGQRGGVPALPSFLWGTCTVARTWCWYLQYRA